MHAARYETLPDLLNFDDRGNGPWTGDHRRLGVCVAFSTLALLVGIASLDVSLRFDFTRWLPLVLDVSLREEPVAQPSPAPEIARESESVSPAPRPEAARSDTPVDASRPAPPDATAAAEKTIDWYESLEHVSADVISQREAPASLHPEFDELRRVAAIRYAEPQTGKPPPVWENVEKDIYGRTLLKKGNCFQILDDTNVGNRYAFETFEQYLMFCTYSGKRPPRNLPWVETIRARYSYLREPAENSLPPVE